MAAVKKRKPKRRETVRERRALAKLRRVTLKSLSERVEALYRQMLWHRQETEKLDTHLYRLFEAQAELRDAYKQVFGIQVGEEMLRMKIDPRLKSIGGYDG